MKKLLVLLVLFISTNVFSFKLPELTRPANEKNFFDVVGRRVFFAGYENGSGEIWSPPYQLIANFSLFDKSGKKLIPLKFKATPAFSEIVFHNFTLQYFAHKNKPLFFVKIVKTTNENILKFKVASILRANWPVDSSQMAPVEIKSEELYNNRFISFTRQMENEVIVGSNVPSKVNLIDKVSGEIILDFKDNDTGYLAVSGVKYGEGKELFLEALKNCDQYFKDSIAYSENILKTFPSIKINNNSKETEKLEESLKWAMVGAAKTFIETPDVGSGYVAGFNVSQKISETGSIAANNGRPGFSWYFGRDFLWMSMALSMINQWDKVKNNFELLRKYQRADGKIMHELTTSVEVMGKQNWADERYYFAAADSTPLYIIALRRYLDVSGDLAFIEDFWPSISKAFDYLIKTDYDGDGLIDNFEGHGWVEGGPLAEGQIAKGHTTFYLASVYVKALEDMQYLSHIMKDNERADISVSLIDKAKETLELYWNGNGYYNHRKYPDGSYGSEVTIAPAVAFIFGVADDKRAKENLINMNGPDIITPWGARFISENESVYDPTLYHAGNVWPLFSGWLSLAYFKYNFANEGYYLLTTILKNTYDNALGYIDEVFRGDRYESVGCPHQGWSETMGLWPFFEGIVGLKFDALNRTIFLKPAFPDSINDINIYNLRVGDSKVDLFIMKNNGSYSVENKSYLKQIKIVVVN